MKTFRQHIKEGGQMGVGTTSHHDSVENGSVGVHNIHEPAIMQRVNAFVGAVADREYIKPEGALADLEEKLGRLGIGFKSPINIVGKNGNFKTELTQHGGRFGKDTDGSDINDDGITHRTGKALTLKGKYETLENGAVRVYAELG
jgi:hypothetical protein